MLKEIGTLCNAWYRVVLKCISDTVIKFVSGIKEPDMCVIIFKSKQHSYKLERH
jgi:hypothetical protein